MLLLSCKELAGQIAARASDFKRAGISSREMETQLQKNREAVEMMEIARESANAEYEEELRQTVLQNFQMAEETFRAVYNTGNLRQ